MVAVRSRDSVDRSQDLLQWEKFPVPAPVFPIPAGKNSTSSSPNSVLHPAAHTGSKAPLITDFVGFELVVSQLEPPHQLYLCPLHLHLVSQILFITVSFRLRATGTAVFASASTPVLLYLCFCRHTVNPPKSFWSNWFQQTSMFLWYFTSSSFLLTAANPNSNCVIAAKKSHFNASKIIKHLICNCLSSKTDNIERQTEFRRQIQSNKIPSQSGRTCRSWADIKDQQGCLNGNKLRQTQRLRQRSPEDIIKRVSNFWDQFCLCFCAAKMDLEKLLLVTRQLQQRTESDIIKNIIRY